MKTPTIAIRIFYRDWKMLRKMIPGMRNETVGHYFERIVNAIKYMQEKK